MSNHRQHITPPIPSNKKAVEISASAAESSLNLAKSHQTPATGHSSKERDIGLDVIRCFAILFVVGAHFFLHTSFNSTAFSGPSMFAQGMLQTLTMMNVPLFLMLTGYLNLNKKVNKKYYKGGIRVLVSYLVISIITVLVRKYAFGESGISWLQWIQKILNFSAIPYGWYIEMWIGLFLLTPFLNILWQNIDTKRNKQILLLTMYILTAFPNFFNRYGITLVPGYWVAMYPMSFFFMGAYVREYQPHVSKCKLLLIILGGCLINPVLNTALGFVHTGTMIHIIGDGYGIVVMPLTMCFFMLCYDLKWNRCKKLWSSISVLSLEMYLFSYIFDIMVYRFFKQHFTDQAVMGYFYPLIIAIIVVLSYAASWLYALIRRLSSALKSFAR